MPSSRSVGNAILCWHNCALHYNPARTMKLLSLRASFAGYPIMKRVIELIRVSTEKQAGNDRASIPAQRSVNRRTCLQYGLEIVRSIQISDVSGAAVLLAPEIKEMIELMQSDRHKRCRGSGI